MKRLFVFFAAASLLLPAACFSYDMEPAAEQGVTAPEGMIVYKVGDTNVIVPKGTRLTVKPGLIQIEPTEEFVARITERFEQRVLQLELELAELKAQMNSPLGGNGTASSQ
jgi:hypothetical protein